MKRNKALIHRSLCIIMVRENYINITFWALDIYAIIGWHRLFATTPPQSQCTEALEGTYFYIEKNYQSSPFVIHYGCEGNSLLSTHACAIDEKNLLAGTGATIFGLHPWIFAIIFSNKLLQAEVNKII